MNGFTNAILSLLLGWIRIFINSFWRLANSENGSSFFQFLTTHWKGLLLLLCAGGFVTDRIIYVLRWRPYYIWLSKRRRLRREREAYGDDGMPENEYAEASEAWEHQSAQPQAAEGGAYGGVVAPKPAPAYQRPAAAYPAGNTASFHFAPAMAQGAPVSGAYPVQPYAPPDDLSPVFDDDLGGWNQSDTLVHPARDGLRTVADGLAPAFGSAMPEPIDYIRDMQAGFARPLPPEQLYSPPAEAVSPAPEAVAASDPHGQVHPGLDLVNFRRNIGLSPAGALPAQPEGQPDAPAFQPYAETEQIRREAAQAAHPRNPFASLAKKARDFVGVNDDEDKPTIRDLQSMVDVKSAFHEPVYPKPLHKDGDEP